jgi:hypothetical protein
MAKISRTRVTDADTSNMDMPHDVESEAYSAEQEEQAPRAFKRTTRPAVSSGWGAKQEERAETVKAPPLKLKDNGTRILKLLDGEPAVKYKRHFVNSKNRYYTCLQNDCPLCKVGVRASWTFIMNVVDLIDDINEVKIWTFGNEVSSQLQNIIEDKEVNLNDIGSYFEVRHVKVAGRSAPGTSVSFLRGRYLQDEYSMEPLTEDEVAELSEGVYGAEVVYINDADYLEDVAADVVPGDLPQKRARD